MKKTYNVIFRRDPYVYEQPIWAGKVKAKNAFDAIEKAKEIGGVDDRHFHMIGEISVKETEIATAL